MPTESTYDDELAHHVAAQEYDDVMRKLQELTNNEPTKENEHAITKHCRHC